MPFILELRKQKQADICEIKVNPIYTVSSRSATATGNSVSKKKMLLSGTTKYKGRVVSLVDPLLP